MWEHLLQDHCLPTFFPHFAGQNIYRLLPLVALVLFALIAVRDMAARDLGHLESQLLWKIENI